MSLKPGTWKIIQELQHQVHMYLAQLNMSLYTRSKSLLGYLTTTAIGFISPLSTNYSIYIHTPELGTPAYIVPHENKYTLLERTPPDITSDLYFKL